MSDKPGEAEIQWVADGYVTHADGTVCAPGCPWPGHEVTP